MGENIINDNDKVLRFDLPIKFGSEELVARCEISPKRSKEDRDAKVKRVYERAGRCAMEGAKLLFEICEFANDPGEVAGLALSYVYACVRRTGDIYERYMHAFGEAVDKHLAKRAAGESESEAGSDAKKD